MWFRIFQISDEFQNYSSRAAMRKQAAFDFYLAIWGRGRLAFYTDVCRAECVDLHYPSQLAQVRVTNALPCGKMILK